LKTLKRDGNFQKSGIFFVLIILFLFAFYMTTLNTSHAAATLYVNGTSGNDSYDGTSLTWVSGTIGPKKTVQNASNAVDPSGTVKVASGTYNEHITTIKSLNIIGANRDTTIIDGTNNGQPLYLDYDLNIANFTIQNGASTYGGGIYNYANLNIINCFITGNTATSAGGAIYNYYGGTLTISNSTLTGNTAPYCGGIANLGTLTLNNSTLTGNTATGGDAGAIYNEGTITLNNSTLTGNTATNYGGAIDSEYGTITLNNSTLTGNTATNRGGAIFNRGTITISNSTLTGNTAYYGGAIYNSGSGAVVTMHFNRVTNNSPNAIYTTAVIAAENNWWGSNSNPSSQFTGSVNYSPWLYMTLTANPTLVLNGGTSTLNASFNNAYDGDIITPINPASGHLPNGCTVTFTTDRGNVGSKTTSKNTSNGAAIATLIANEGTGTAHLSAQLDSQTVNTAVGVETLYVNGATGNDSWDGTSPTYISGTTGPMKTIQTAVNAINTGGTINVASATYIESGDYSGHISIGKSLNLIGENLVSTIIDGANNGRLIFIFGGLNVTIANFTLRNGTFGGTGGAIATMSNLTIINCNITGNNATYGGAIYTNSGTTTITNSTLTGNNATQHGGAIYNQEGTLTLNNSTLTGNTATVGGAIYNPGVLSVKGSIFTSNTASISGGAIYNSISSTLTITNSTLTGNSASTTAGAIFNMGTLTIAKSILTENIATTYGGAILNGDTGSLTTTNSTLNGNTANYGGAIYNNGGSVTMHFNRVVGNAPNTIYTNAVIDAQNNWWGSNSNPSSQFTGTVNYSPWLYMTLTANPTLILNGATSTLTANFNNAYDGDIITPINPASGHIPDNSVVTFTTDLGSVGSPTTTKNTSNGIATATLTADAGIGTANITAQLDSQTLTTTVVIKDTLYVNGATGDDKYDGLNPTFISGTKTGPKQTITNALETLNTAGITGTINVASGTYTENIIIESDVNLQGNNTNNTIITTPDPNNTIITIGKIKEALITGFTIQGAEKSNGVIINGGEVTLKNNNIFNNEIGINIAKELKPSTITQNNIKYNNIGISTHSDVKINYNSLLENNIDIYSDFEDTINATHNWWGSNSESSDRTDGNINYNPWLVLTVNATPILIKKDATSTITANLNHDSDGTTVTGHLMDGTPVTFTTTLGTINSPKYTQNGTTNTTLHGGSVSGVADITTTVDNEEIHTPVTVDATTPTVTSTNPAQYAVNLPSNQVFTVTFSEAIKAANLNLVVLKTSTGTVIATTKTITGNVLTITPNSALSEAKYLLLLYAGCVTDLAGNPAAALSRTYGVGAQPYVTSTDPVNYALNVPRNKVITATFNEPIVAKYLTLIYLKTVTGGIQIATTKSVSENTLTIAPTSPLAANTRYMVLIYTFAVTDLAGNSNVNKQFTFTTGAT
jgi:predicted outer membrane repeat protein